MGKLRQLKEAICYTDMFYSSEMLRYNHDTQYKTFTGGLITLGVIVIVIVGFFSMISQTLNRTAITSTLDSIISKYPSYYNLQSDSDNMFMFGLQIQPLDLSFIVNLSSGPRYFDVTLSVMQQRYGIIVDTTRVPMVQCTDAHWSMLPSVVESSKLLGYSSWLCPQIGQSLPLQGNYYSPHSYLTFIKIGPCNNATDPNNLCAPQNQIDEFMNTYRNFIFAVNYINTVINPSQPSDLTYYLQGNDYVIFSATQASQAWFYFSDFKTTTDSSIWPFSNQNIQVGALTQNKAINHPFTPSNQSGYVNAYFAKASNSLFYNRSVQKISAVFSYIGGLVGAISAVLFFLKFYTEMSLQMNIAMGLFKQQKQQKQHQQENKSQQKQIERQKHNQSSSQNNNQGPQKQKDSTIKGFHILSFINLVIYKIFKKCKFTKKWSQEAMLDNFQKQILYQLDIKTLLRRIISLQNCMSCLLQEHQLDGLRYQKKISYAKARQLRRLLVQQDQKQLQIVERPKRSLKFGLSKSNSVANCYPQQGIVVVDTISSPENLFSEKQSKNEDILQKSYNNLEIFKAKLSKADSIIDESKNKDQQQSINQNDESTRRQISIKTLKNLKMLKQKADNSQVNKRIWKNMNAELKQFIAEGPIIRQSNSFASISRKFKHKNVNISDFQE